MHVWEVSDPCDVSDGSRGISGEPAVTGRGPGRGLRGGAVAGRGPGGALTGGSVRPLRGSAEEGSMVEHYCVLTVYHLIHY